MLKTFDTREQWLAARSEFIGASESPVAFGLGYKGQTLLSLWSEKCGILPNDFDGASDLLEFSTLVEPAILSLFHKRTGLHYQKNEGNAVYLCDSHPFIGATVDSFIIESDDMGVGECKNVVFAQSQWTEHEVPQRHLIQIQQQLLCTGLNFGYLIGWCGHKLKYYRVERDDRFINEILIPTLSEFWESYVVKRIAPPIVDADDGDVLKRMHPDDNGEAVALNSDQADIVRQWRKAKEAEAGAKASAELLGAQIRMMLGPNTFGQLDTGEFVSWKTSDVAGYVVQSRKQRTLRFHEAKKGKR